MPQHLYVMKVPNDAEGRALIDGMKRNLNTERYTLTTRFGGPRPHTSFKGHTRKADATYLRVYMHDKTKTVSGYPLAETGGDVHFDQHFFMSGVLRLGGENIDHEIPRLTI